MNQNTERLEALIILGADNPPASDSIVEQFAQTTLLAFGSNEDGTTSLLHFNVDDDENTYLPVFTRPEILEFSRQLHPEWARYTVVSVTGADLLRTLEEKRRLVLNPWSRLEFHIHPDQPQPTLAG